MADMRCSLITWRDLCQLYNTATTCNGLSFRSVLLSFCKNLCSDMSRRTPG